MKRTIIFSVLLFVSSLISSKAHSTPQAADTLIWYGQEFLLQKESGKNSYLLESFFQENPNKRPKTQPITSAHRRGYIVTFELGYHALFLKNIEKINIVHSQNSDMLPTITRDSIFSGFIPSNKPVRADWFSGILVLRSSSVENKAEYPIPQSTLKHKEYSLVEIVNGYITDIRSPLNYEQYQALKDKQFNYFKQTSAFEKEKQKRLNSSQSVTSLLNTTPSKFSKIEKSIRDEVFDVTEVLYDNKAFQHNFPKSYISKIQSKQTTNNVVSLESLAPGEMLRMYQGGQFVLLYKRTEQDKQYLKKNTISILADPNSKNFKGSLESRLNNSSSIIFKSLLTDFQPEIDKRTWRSLSDDYFVFSRRSPYSNCNIELAQKNSDVEQPIIFYDPCTDTSFDAAGRVLKGKVKSLHIEPIVTRFNLFIPPHHFIDQHTVKLDLPSLKGDVEKYQIPKQNYASLTANEKLILAASYNDIQAVKAAMADNADLNFYNQNNTSSLDAAIMGSSTPLVSLLIKEGAAPNWEAFDAATSLSRTDIQRLLLKSGLD